METLAQQQQDDVDLFHRIRHLVQTHLQESEEQYELVHSAIVNFRRRVVLSISFLNTINPQFARRMLQDPFSCFPATETALADVARSIATLSKDFLTKKTASVKEREQIFNLRLGLSGWLGSHSVTPRGLTARLANKMISVQGIVTKCSLINPKLTFGTYYIPELDRHFFREQVDNVTINPRSTLATNGRTIAASVDDEGRKIEMEIGLSVYKDSQRITVQEMPEMTPSGQLPRTVEIVCEYDLVDRVNPGDRARFWGVLRSIPSSNSNLSSGFANCFLVANNIEQLNIEKRCPTITPANLKEFRNVSCREDLLDIVAASVAPSISGHDIVKRGLALQVVGGDRKFIEGDGSRLRGDIHILLIGDPSCGKSQMLRFMMNLAPMALSTTGRGSSAVGLTAAVVIDSDTGERRLEAGAMVLADGGLVCIDEFDKMGFDDRVAVHEVMEQQRVTINKAGISATLNARTSVLAAANPIYGLFDDSVDFSKQINFPDSLLSRFDLIYIIRESSTPQQDRKISSQVLSQLRTPHEDSLHQLAGIIPGQRSTTIQPDAIVLSDKPTNKPNKQSSSVWTKQGQVLSVSFLRKYLQYCRSQPGPVLTDEAVEQIAEFYADLRERLTSGSAIGAKAIPTPRLLEACIRLATAHAKLKLKKIVDVTDVAEAKKLILFTMCGDEPQPTVESHAGGGRKRKLDDEIVVEIATSTLTLEPAVTRKRVKFSTDIESATSCETQRVTLLSTVIEELRTKYDCQEFELENLVKSVREFRRLQFNFQVRKYMEKKRDSAAFEDGEMMAGLRKLQEQNQLM